MGMKMVRRLLGLGLHTHEPWLDLFVPQERWVELDPDLLRVRAALDLVREVHALRRMPLHQLLEHICRV